MTKTIAKAAQNYPQSRSLVRVSQRGVLALMLGTVALPVSGAWAQQVLSGAQTSTQSPTVGNGLPLVVTTASGFSVDTTGPLGGGGKGIDLYSRGGISFTDTNQATITGISSGINALNRDQTVNGVYPRNSVTVTTTGVVTGKQVGTYDGNGISATNEYGGDITISVASVMGGGNGTAISAQGVLNTGALTITATGAVGVGAAEANSGGIRAVNQGTDLTISAAAVSYGISAKNQGSGALSITATGEVTKDIQATQYQYGTSLTINAAQVSGQVAAFQYGTGALSITASGDVTAQFNDAIYARNEGTALTISATAVTGNAFGIKATNNGSGALSITASDDVIGTGGDGIYAVNAGTALTISATSVSGGYDGIEAKNLGSGALSITATGAVTGTKYEGIQAYGKGTDLTISATSVSGGYDGIEAISFGSGEVDITATGAVTGTNYNGIQAKGKGTDLTISAASVTGGTKGIEAISFGSGALSITATGAVIGTSNSGIYAYVLGTDLTITAASVAGGSTGIHAISYGTGEVDITATGAVIGTSADGIYAYGLGTDLTISAAAVSGGDEGIWAQNKGIGALSITASDDVIGTGGDGIYAYGKGTHLTITATSVSGGGNGIKAKNKGTGALSITTTGTVSAAGDYSDGIYAINYGTDLTISVHSASGGKYEKAVDAFNKGSGKLSITVSGAVVAGAHSNAVGIETKSADGGEVEIHLLSTSSVSGPEAITDRDSDAVVTIDAGALVTGSIGLNYGNDTLTIASGVNLSGVTGMSGGYDDVFNAIDFTDTLNISSGWSGNLTDWEVINADTSGGDFALGGVISGNGVLEKRGTGTVLVSGTNTLTGAATVYGGRLNVTGSLGTSSAVTVKNGASLGGTGTVGPLIAQAGATISPGMSIGTLTVNGNLTLQSGSTLAMEIGQSSSDLIHATGTASLGGDLFVTPGLGLTFGHTYTLVSGSANSPNPNSVTGTFSDISIAGAFDYVATYNPTSVQLQLNAGSLVDFGASALSANARAVAGAFDAAVDGGFDPQAFVNLYAQANNFNAAVSQFSGELHSAERRAALADTSVVREAALDRLGYGLRAGADATAAAGDGAFWLRDFASWGTADADGTGSRATTDQAGFLMGADFVQGNVKYGGMFSYTNTNVDLGSLGYSKTNSTGAALYAGYRQDGAGLAFAAGGAFASTTAMGERSISITGLEQTLTSRVEGTSYQIFGEVSNDLAKAGNVQIEPFARLAYASAHSDAFAETGGVAALSGAKQTNDLRMATLGLRGAYVAGNTTLSGSAAWLRSAGDLSAPTTLSMAGADTPYEVNAAALDQDAVELAAQASVHLAPDMTLAGGYSGTIGKNNATHGVRVTLSVAW